MLVATASKSQPPWVHRTRSCVAMLADLFHAEDPQHPTGTATIGSSEAILLAGLAFKRRWQVRPITAVLCRAGCRQAAAGMHADSVAASGLACEGAPVCAQARRKKEGKPTDKPNIVMGTEVHVSFVVPPSLHHIKASRVLAH